jgi:hypothetical protein
MVLIRVKQLTPNYQVFYEYKLAFVLSGGPHGVLPVGDCRCDTKSIKNCPDFKTS